MRTLTLITALFIYTFSTTSAEGANILKNTKNTISSTSNKLRQDPNLRFWHGSKILLEFGTYIIGKNNSEDAYAHNNKSTDISAGYMQGVGFEYGYLFNNKLYVGFSAVFDFFVPEFESENTIKSTKGRKIRFIVWPITYSRVGYVVNKRIKIFLGMAYAWGIEGGVRFKITNSLYTEIRGHWWLDQYVKKPPFFAYDKGYFCFTLGFKL